MALAKSHQAASSFIAAPALRGTQYGLSKCFAAETCPLIESSAPLTSSMTENNHSKLRLPLEQKHAESFAIAP